MAALSRLRTLVRIIRVPFIAAVVLSALLGAVLAWHDGALYLGSLLLTIAGAVLVNASLNLSNDYFDHLSGTNAGNKSPTPFSGPSRAIQEGVVAPHRMLRWSLAMYALGIAIGLYHAAAKGWPILLIGVVGVFIAFFQNAPPVRLYHLAPCVGEAGQWCGLWTLDRAGLLLRAGPAADLGGVLGIGARRPAHRGCSLHQRVPR